jgi:hypothetical protein
MVQTSFGFSGRFWPIRRPLFHGVCCREAIAPSVVMLVSEADPLRLRAGSPSIGVFIVIEMGAIAVKPVAWREAGVRVDGYPSFIVRKLAAVGG